MASTAQVEITGMGKSTAVEVAALEDGRKKVEKLKELAALKEQGILTEEEFAQQKAVILAPPPAAPPTIMLRQNDAAKAAADNTQKGEGYRVGETVYFASNRATSLITGKMFAGTARITFGQRGEVMGPYPKDASQLSIKFEQQNGLESLLTVCLPTELSRSKPLAETSDAEQVAGNGPATAVSRAEKEAARGALFDIAILPGNDVPSQNKLQLNLTETINVDGKTFHESHPDCSDSVWLCCCPWSPFTKYTSKDEVLRFKNQCTCFCCPWEAFIGSQKIGYTRAPNCCENGICFCLCPWCTCAGEITMQFFHGADGQQKYTIRRNLFPCWPFVTCCAPCGHCMQCIADCCSYCSNVNYSSVREELRGVGKGAPVVGYIHTVDRIDLDLCWPKKVPVRYSVELINGPDGKDLQMLGLIPLLYKGVAVPCRCCAFSPVPRITGVWCMDAGRHYKKNSFTAKQMVASLGAPDSAEMER